MLLQRTAPKMRNRSSRTPSIVMQGNFSTKMCPIFLLLRIFYHQDNVLLFLACRRFLEARRAAVKKACLILRGFRVILRRRECVVEAIIIFSEEEMSANFAGKWGSDFSHCCFNKGVPGFAITGSPPCAFISSINT